jgi:bacterioferritin
MKNMRIITAQVIPGDEAEAPVDVAAPVEETNIQRLGVSGKHISEALLTDVDGEMGHAKTLSERLHTLGYKTPCSSMFRPRQKSLSCETHGDLQAVVMGVIEAEEGAISLYKEIAELCEQTRDFGTLDIVSAILVDEEKHKREFEDFLNNLE